MNGGAGSRSASGSGTGGNTPAGGGNRGGTGSNKLLFWLVSRPRRIRINCCFVYSQDDDVTSSDPGSSSAPRVYHSRNQSTGSSHQQHRRRVKISRDDIGLPYDFRHTTHLGPESDLTNAHQLSNIVCSNF